MAQIEKMTNVVYLKKMLHAAQCHRDRLELNEHPADMDDINLDILRLKMRLEEIAPEPLTAKGTEDALTDIGESDGKTF